MSEKIITLTAQSFGVNRDDMLARKRTLHLLIPRQFAIYLVYNWTQCGVTEIGKIFGLDHSTIINAIRKTENLLDVNKRERDRVVEILHELAK